MPKVSIGLPVYNGDKFIEEAINSILNQTFDDFELIISDNASTDRTQEICESYASNDGRIQYYRNKRNHGAAWNYNRVFELSKGEYFKWASHDDMCAPTYLERCVKVLEQKPSVVLCYSKTVIIDEHGSYVNKYYDDLNLASPEAHDRLRSYLFRSAGECNAVFGVIRSSCLKKTSLIGNYNGSDMILLAHLALVGKFYEIPEELFFRRDHPRTSLRANTSDSEIAAWFDPAKRGKIVLPQCRWSYEYFRCIMLADLRIIDRVCYFALVGRQMWWNKEILKNEITVAAKYLLSRRRGV